VDGAARRWLALAAGVVLAVGFVLFERRAKHPAMPLTAFRRRARPGRRSWSARR
jgi:DHA2 family methylenomycin A resistance protein-like MFS transporter